MSPRRVVDREDVPPPKELSDDLRQKVTSIKLTSLKLCQLIVDATPPGVRREAAMGSIRSGVRLAIELIAGGATTPGRGRPGGRADG